MEPVSSPQAASEASSSSPEVGAPTTPEALDRRQLAKVSLAALGVVYGDIGTSPLYALRECFYGPHATSLLGQNVYGVLSLITWSLIIVISIKYLLLIVRADKHGEGGILALTALITPKGENAGRTRRLAILLGVFGSALLYADGMITPAISVLSAVEGVQIAAPGLDDYVVPITIVILTALFLFQSKGTTRVGSVFGPIVLLWFITIGLLGLASILRHPQILLALSPHFAVQFFATNGLHGFLIMGTVFLVVTGGEALYADIGHFGVKPIRMAWFTVVLPGLLLNYFGQGALLLRDPEAIENPFYRLAPEWGVLPLVILAASAAVIASQAIITGAFSLTLQAVQLGYSPRLRVEHTSSEQIGQVYLPAVNWALMIACIALVLHFESSGNLAAAYGVAITITMVITTLLFFVFVRDRWNWSLPQALGVCGGFLILDVAYFLANLPKVGAGGWLPLVVSVAIFTLLTTWKRGREVLGDQLRERLIPLELFLAETLSNPPQRVPGVAIFMTGNRVGTPPALRHNLQHNHVMHEKVVILVVETAEVPRVPESHRAEIEEIGAGVWRVVLTYGYMGDPHVPRALSKIKLGGIDFGGEDVSYFLGNETLIAAGRMRMARWRERLFAWLSRNAQSATRYFRLPPDRIMEVGVQVEL